MSADRKEVIPGMVDFDPWLLSPDGGLKGLVTLALKTNQVVSMSDNFTATISIDNVSDLAGFQLGLAFDPAILEATQVEEGPFLSDDGSTYWIEPNINNTTGEIGNIACGRITKGGINGGGALATITFRAIGIGDSYLRLQNVTLSDSNGEVITAVTVDVNVTVVEFPSWDVNKDGVVNIVDIVLVGQSFGLTPVDPNPDVNGDGIVNIQDIVLVGQHFGETYPPGAPPGDLWAIDPRYLPVLAMIYNIMEHSPASGPGFLTTKELIHRLIHSTRVSRTILLQNYPNPFNPDTYIPYQLAEGAYVTIGIYSSSGQLVRTIDLGHKVAGVYVDRGAAAHWDGRSDNGELAASGIYYYSIQAGDYSATRKMVVAQ